MNKASPVTYKVGRPGIDSLVDPDAENTVDVTISYVDRKGKLVEQVIIIPYDSAVELGAYMGDEAVEETLLAFRNQDYAWFPGWGGLTLPVIARKIAKFSSKHYTHMKEKFNFVYIRVNMKTGVWMLMNTNKDQDNMDIIKLIEAGDPNAVKVSTK